MNLSDVETFLAIVNCRSISQAADSLFLTQSTISQRLKALETELGVTLIERRKGLRNVELSTKGTEFIPIAEKWLALHQETMNLKHSNPKVSLSVASPDSLNIYILMPFFKKLSAIDVPLYFLIRTQQSVEIYDLVENKEVDIGFVFRDMRYKNIISRLLFKEKMYMICKGGSAWPSGPIHPNQLDPGDELYLPWSPEIQKWHEYWWNPTAKPHAQVDTAALILNFMDNPKYWALCPISVVNSFRRQKRDIEVHEFTEEPPQRECYMLIHRTPRASNINNIKLFNRYLNDFVSSLSWDLEQK